MRLSSIRARMTLGLTLFVALLTSVSGAGLWLRNYVEAQHQYHAILETTTERVRQATRHNASWDDIASIVREQNLGAPDAEVELWRIDSKGEDVGHVHTEFLGRPAPPPPPPPPADSLSTTSPGSVPPVNNPGDWDSERVPLGNDSLLIAVPWHRARRALSAQALALFLLGLFTSAASGLGAWVLVGRTLSPIERLASQARDRAQEGRNASETVLSAPSPDHEVQELVATFNALLGSVAEGARQRERFHAAASHELRTPLQALSGTLQLALSRPRSNQEYETALRTALAQSGRLNALTRDLLTLNQLELGTTRTRPESVDVAEACDLSLSSLQDTIARKALVLKESLPPLEVLAPPSHVEMLCRNLLENAAKYAPQSGVINVETTANSLLVWNQTEHSIDGDLSSWCEPFYRPDEARTSTIGGNGLGLAICRALCDSNGWKLHLEPTRVGKVAGVSACVQFASSSNR